MKPGDIVAVILNWNDAETTLQCVATAREWRQVKADIWVVDNGSGEQDWAILEAGLSGVCLLRRRGNSGFSGGNNLALESLLADELSDCQSPILLLNNDARIDEEDVRIMLDLLREHPGVGIIGPLLYEVGAFGTCISAGGNDIVSHLNAHRLLAAPPADLPPLLDVNYVPGTIALFSPQALRDVGLFDERYFFGAEVADWCERARRRGWWVAIATRAVGRHYLAKPDGVRDTLYLYYSLRNRLLFTRKFAGRWRLLYWLMFYLKIGLGRLYRGQPASARAVFLAAWHGLIGRFGNQNHLFGR